MNTRNKIDSTSIVESEVAVTNIIVTIDNNTTAVRLMIINKEIFRLEFIMSIVVFYEKVECKKKGGSIEPPI